jgi:ketosteroid isomerase-like protein
LSPAAFVEAHWRNVIEGRVEDVIAAYQDSDSTYVFTEGPRWSTRGRERIAAGWRAYLQAPFRLVSYQWIEGPQEAVVGEVGWCAGIADFGVERASQSSRLRLRFTFVLRQDAGRWRIVHEHFSQPASDPYGTGDWLKPGV